MNKKTLLNNNHKVYGFLLVFLMLIPALSLSAFDWGLQLDQTFDAEGIISEAHDISYSGSLIPWFSTIFGPNGNASFYLSAGVTGEYYHPIIPEGSEKSASFIPELLHTELAWRFGSNKELKIGRLPYTDPLGFIASGLFDGMSFSLDTNAGVFGAGVWYTGLLFKRNADITMTGADQSSYYKKLDYSKFSDTYFAPRRLMAALDWDNPYLAQRLRLRASLIGQYDFTGNDTLYHSQYLVLKASVPAGSFVFDIGASAELAEVSKNASGDSSYDTKTAFAGDLGIAWFLPTPIKDMLKLSGRFTSGVIEDSSIAAFVPITTVSQGDILQAKLSGLSMLRLDYTAQPFQTFSFNVASSYFIASDKGTYTGFPYASSGGRDGYFLGNEFSGRLIWSPFSDLQFNLGGGVFLPSLGNSGSTNGVLWRVELNAILAIF